MLIKQMFVFFGYGFFIIYLIYTGEITRFISPRIVWLTYFGGFSLLLFLLVLLIKDETYKNHKPIWRDVAKGILFIYPLILFFTINPSDISTVYTHSVKALPQKRPVLKRPTLLSLPQDSEGYVRVNLFELWLLARNYPELTQRYKFKTSGMVSDVGEKHISVSRLYMVCCVADATPVEVDVLIGGIDRFAKGDWIDVTGGIILREHVIILPDSINPSQKPSEPYITRWSEQPPFNP